MTKGDAQPRRHDASPVKATAAATAAFAAVCLARGCQALEEAAKLAARVSSAKRKANPLAVGGRGGGGGGRAAVLSMGGRGRGVNPLAGRGANPLARGVNPLAR